MSLDTNIDRIVKRAGDKIVNRFLRQINRTRAGSKMPMHSSGSLGTGLHHEISYGPFTTLKIKGARYGLALDQGVPTPFSWSGIGPDPGSEYIRGLVRWLGIKKGLTGRAALQAAFRIARVRREQSTITPDNPGWIKDIIQEVDRDTSIFFQTETTLAVDADIRSKLNIKI